MLTSKALIGRNVDKRWPTSLGRFRAGHGIVASRHAALDCATISLSAAVSRST